MLVTMHFQAFGARGAMNLLIYHNENPKHFFTTLRAMSSDILARPIQRWTAADDRPRL
jgi:hypothetical protein